MAGTRTSPRTTGLQPLPGLSSPRRARASGDQHARVVSTRDVDLGPEASHESGDSAAHRLTSSTQVENVPIVPRASVTNGNDVSNEETPTQLVGLPAGGKPSCKNITIASFTGRVEPGVLDSGGRKWWRQFNDQLIDAQVFDGHRWTDLQQRSVLSASLSDLAADWFIRLKQDSPSVSVQEAGKLLILQFSSPLGENVLRKTLTEAKKRRVETYMEYAGRLLDIADSLPGGSSLETNSRQAVYAFVEHAHPAYEKDLDRLVRKKISKGILARAVLDTAVAALVALTKSNGQAELYRSRYAPKRGPPSADVEDQPAKRSKDSDGRSSPSKGKGPRRCCGPLSQAAQVAQAWPRNGKEARMEDYSQYP
ncbi:hypothetical protein PF007_g29047, partial [Phytophthora fragariae]